MRCKLFERFQKALFNEDMARFPDGAKSTVVMLVNGFVVNGVGTICSPDEGPWERVQFL